MQPDPVELIPILRETIPCALKERLKRSSQSDLTKVNGLQTYEIALPLSGGGRSTFAPWYLAGRTALSLRRLFKQDSSSDQLAVSVSSAFWTS